MMIAETIVAVKRERERERERESYLSNLKIHNFKTENTIFVGVLYQQVRSFGVCKKSKIKEYYKTEQENWTLVQLKAQ